MARSRRFESTGQNESPSLRRLQREEVGIAADARLGCVEPGFSPAHSQAWTEVDVFTYEDRVWRAKGLSVEDAHRRRAAGGGALTDDDEVRHSTDAA
jgi:hypothetical protein